MSQHEPMVGPLIGHIQTDTFCESCGYNLHTQAVLRDERLGILVCRCPECGRFAPAGHATAARQIWLNRLGIGLLVVWVIFLLWLFGMCSLFLGMSAYGNLMNQVQWIAPPPTTMPVNRMVTLASYHYELRNASSPEEAIEQRNSAILMATLAGALGMLTGGLFAVLLWHSKNWRRLLAFAPPLIGVWFAIIGWQNDRMTILIRDWGLNRLIAYMLLECGAVAVGLWLGRPIARTALKILLPPKLLQHLAFLWTTDGKQLRLNN
jgi:hypothetical protein